MSRPVSWVALAVAGVLVGVIAGAQATTNRANAGALATGLAVPYSAESTTLFCTGFTGVDGPAPAVVTFFNLSHHVRSAAVQIHPNRGRTVQLHLVIEPESSITLPARRFSSTAYYGVSALFDGGGVTGVVRGVGLDTSTLSCATQGQSAWLAAGLTTLVGSTTVVSLLNPAASAAVVNLTALTSTGPVAPAAFQGLVVSPHAEIAVTLNPEIVDEKSVAVDVAAVSGTVVAAAATVLTGRVKGALLIGGAPGAAQRFSFPDLPTNALASSTIAFANATDETVAVTVRLVLGTSPLRTSGSAAIAPFEVTLEPESTNALTVSPASRVPVAGAGSVEVTATGPVTATLVTNSPLVGPPWYSAPTTSSTAQVIYSEGRGFGSLRLLNPGPGAVTASLRAFGAAAAATVTIPARSVLAVPSRDGGRATLLFVRSSGPLQIAGAWGGKPNGVRVVNGSGGG